MAKKEKSITYKDSGVDIDTGNEFVKKLPSIVNSTFDKNVINGIGDFAALYSLENEHLSNPILVSACDGVGTKIRLAIDMKNYYGAEIKAESLEEAKTVGGALAQGHLEKMTDQRFKEFYGMTKDEYIKKHGDPRKEELDEALEIADRVIVLHEGNLVGEYQNKSENIQEIVSSFSGSAYKQDSSNYGT